MRFEAPLSFAAKGKQMTKRLIAYVVDAFRSIRSVAELSKEIGISTTSIFRIVACLFVPRKRLPRVFCMDEFKGDSGGSKYQTTLADGEAKEIVDILPTRYGKDLDAYFSSIDRKERQGVEIFVSDMCGTFKGVKEAFFPQSTHARKERRHSNCLYLKRMLLHLCPFTAKNLCHDGSDAVDGGSVNERSKRVALLLTRLQ